jgi:DNA-binding MarR family transcriptional regulator
MADTRPLDPDYNLWMLLEQVTILTFNATDQELSEYGTTAMQAAVLFVINQIGEETTPAEISRWILRKPSSITGILKRMVKAGLVERTKDLPKKNMVRVRLTEKGQGAYKQSLKRKPIHQIMSALSQEERRQLASLLEKLRTKAIKVGRVKYKPPFP